MKKLSPSEIWPPAVYESVRQDFRARVIAHKRPRRLSVGPFMTWVFEDRLTVKFQIQEIVHAERLSDPAQIAEEVEAFNEMIPGPDELSATLLIDSASEAEARERLAGLVGLRESVFLEIGGARVKARFDPGREDGARVSAVQYLRFPLPREAVSAFLGGAAARLVVEHPRYRAAVTLEGETRRSLEADLREGGGVDVA
jgi:hypothetical protein